MSTSTTHIVVDSVPASHISAKSPYSNSSTSNSPQSTRSTGRPRSNSASLQREVEAERVETMNEVKQQESERFDRVEKLHHQIEDQALDTMAMFARKAPDAVEVPVSVDDTNNVSIISQETFIIKPPNTSTQSSHQPAEHLDIPSNSTHTHATLIDTLNSYDPANHSHHQNILPSKPFTSLGEEQLQDKDAQIAALSMALIKARSAHREAVYQHQLLTDPEAATISTNLVTDDSRPLTSAVDRSSALLTVVPTAKDDQSLRSYLQKLPIKRDSLMIKRSTSGDVTHKFVTLTYDALYVSENADEQGSKVAALNHYWLIERAEDRATTGTISGYAAAHARQANAPSAPISPMAGHSVFRKEGDSHVIRLVPIVRDPSAPHLIVEPDVSQLLELTASADVQDILADWVDAINLRISLLNLLKAEDHSQVLAHGGKQILTFLCSVDSNRLVLENRYLNALQVLPHFKEALVHRRNYSITFRNVGLDDNGLRVLSEILMMNHSITAIDLSWNAITDAGMSYLAPVFELNKQALNESVNLSYNMIQTEGLREFAQAISSHPVRNIILKGNQFGDDAIMEFFTALNTQSTQSDEDKPNTRSYELLDFSDNALTNASIGPIGSMLAFFTIESLNLSRNQFTDAGLAALMVRLKQGQCVSLSSLRAVDLSYNRFTAGAVTHLINLIKSTRNVRLDLSGNHLSSQVLKTLLDSDVPLQIDSLAIRSTQNRASDSELSSQHSLEKRLENATAGVSEKVNSARLTAGSLFGRLMGRKGSRAESSPSPVSPDDSVGRRGSFSNTNDVTDKAMSPNNEKSKTPEPVL